MKEGVTRQARQCQVMLGNSRSCQEDSRCGNMFEIVPRHVKTCHVLRHDKMCVKECQGNKREHQVEMKINEHIRGLVSQDLTVSRRAC